MKFFSAVLLGVVLGFTTGAVAGGRDKFPLHKSPRDVQLIEFTDEAGEAFKLSDWKGRVVLLNVWATWCPPCRKEMPTLDKLQAELGGDQFAVVALSVDRSGAPVVRKFYEKIDIKNLKIYVDPTMKTQRQLKLFGLPGTLLLGPDGKELGRLLGPAEWDTPEMLSQFRNIIRQTLDEK